MSHPTMSLSSLLRRFPILVTVLSVTAVLLVATPAWGDVVVLKDGTQILTREKYRREGDRVYLVLQNGTETFIAASEIDFAKTEELKSFSGQARVLDPGSVKVVEETAPQEQKPTLRDLVGKGRLSLPEPKRESGDGEVRLPLTGAGFVDLWSFQARILPDTELSEELSRHLTGQGDKSVRVFQGTAAKRVLLRLTANSESAVLQGLKDAATAFVQAQARFPGRIASLELVMSTESEKRAGQFVLTRELADQLLSGAIDPPTFFYRHVQF